MKNARRRSPPKKPKTGPRGRPRAAGGGSRGAQYTVRNVPPTVDAVLRRKAAEAGKSLNEVLREALFKEAGLAGHERPLYDDLDYLAGTWVEDPEFDAAIAAQDLIDESLWK